MKKKLWSIIVIALCGFVPLALIAAKQTPPPLAWDQDGCIWGPTYGVKPGPDCTAALQTLIQRMAASQTGPDGVFRKGTGFSMAKIKLPPGQTTASASWDTLPVVRIIGAGTGLTVLTSQDPIATVQRGFAGGVGTVNIEIRDLTITNTNPTSTTDAPADACDITGIFMGVVQRCSFTARAGRGWFSGRRGNPPLPNTSLHFTDCMFLNNGQDGFGGWARVQFDNCVYTGNDIGQNVSGTVVANLQRFEENRIGRQTGLLSSCTGVWNSSTLEANSLHESVLKNSMHCIFNADTVVGDKYRGTTFPNFGIESFGQNCTWNSANLSGTFTTATINLQPTAGQHFFTQTQAGNAQIGAPVWQNQSPQGDLFSIQTPTN